MRSPTRLTCHKGPAQQRGVAAVEFALVIFILLLAVAGIIEFGRAFWYYNALAKATRDGARFLAVAPITELAPRATGSSTNCPPEGGTVRNLVFCAVTDANVSDFDITNNVGVQCRYAGGEWTACVPGTQAGPFPEYVRVAITNYQITIGGIFPFFLPTGDGTTSWVAPLAPHTTMRYQR